MAYLIVIACLIAVENDCKEIPLTNITGEDVTLCIRDSHANAMKWEQENKEYRVIGTKCVKK
jgi:hypothetical protein